MSQTPAIPPGFPAPPVAAPPDHHPERILLVEDDPSGRQAMGDLLTAEGFDVVLAASGTEALARLGDGIAVIVTDLQMPGLDGLQLLEAARLAAPHAPVIMVTGHGTQEIAVKALKSGAFHYITKPANPDELIGLVRQALDKHAMARQIARLHRELKESPAFGGMVGYSPPIRRVFEKVRMVADTRSTVLVEGESGTGKELVARALHLQSGRSAGPFVAVNCAALPESLIESELFGHERGAFTGASERRVGKFQAAHGGTLLIDEIGEMKLDLQAKLLRAIERRAITPVGSNKEIEVDVRIVASTHRNLRELVAAGSFREDLYYRLNVVAIQIPALRQRCEDIPLLTRYFIEEIARESGRPVSDITPAAQALLWLIRGPAIEPHVAVVWSGICNFAGVLVSSGAVAFGIISLLPVELILQVGAGAGFAMVFALLIAAILWNLGTWYFGLPASSSHTMVGSIIGVGIANALMNARSGTSGVDWDQARKIGESLLISPAIGFIMAALILLLAKVVIKDKRLYEAPVGTEPPPFWIRGLLILTCTGVSFSHGSNDGQKGMGLIMLILVGTVPTAYALNHAVTQSQTADFLATSQQTVQVVSKYVKPSAVVADSRDDLTNYIRTKEFNDNTMLALRQYINEVGNEVAGFRMLRNVPNNRMGNLRNEMYVISEAIRLIEKSGKTEFDASDKKILANYKKHIDLATKFIPTWVKVAVAIALGLGTMIGWKRIVVTVGEKIGKDHLTYGQGAAAEITAMVTISTADMLGLPVSTTHVLSSGVAGTMAANHSGLQWGTMRNLLMAWVLTMPVAMMLSGFLFWAFRAMTV